MNINFSNIIKQFIPFFMTVYMAYMVTSILYFVLPKQTIDISKKQNIILEYNKFNIKNIFKEKIIKKQAVKVVKQEYQLLSNITLKAIYMMNEEKGWIVILDKTNKTHILSIKENFKGYKLIRIYNSYVIFENSNKEYKLELNLNKKKVQYTITKTSQTNNSLQDETIIVLDDKVSVKRAYLNSYINNFDKIWQDIAINEIKNANGQISGFKVNYIRNHSAFEKLGLQRGDIIKSVNNIKLNSYNNAFSIYKKINNINDLNIKILRNGKERELYYEIK